MLAALDMETFLGKLPAPEIIGARSIPRTYYPNANELLPNVRFANCIVMYQHLGSDITEFLTRCGILRNQDPLKRLSTSVNDVPSAPCEEILTPAMMDVICKRYRQEMEDWSFLVDGKAVGYGNLTRGDSGA
jgi:hypothetical protein